MNKKNKTIKPIQNIKPTNNIDRLLSMLNDPSTSCKFWKSINEECDISGIRRVNRKCTKVMNEHGFNPKPIETEEVLFKYYNIDICDTIDRANEEDIKKEEELKSKGIRYIKSHDVDYIFEVIRGDK